MKCRNLIEIIQLQVKMKIPTNLLGPLCSSLLNVTISFIYLEQKSLDV